ncbi:MAG: hypothetical protein ACRECO_12500 [Xanthobacteraceae bacterium]
MRAVRRTVVSACRAAIVAGLLLGGGAALAQTTSSYGVFCANGRIEIDSRSEEQMRRQRSACQFARFSFRMDAESFARKNFKRVGAPCSCR